MPNRVRPHCLDCGKAMAPVFVGRKRAASVQRLKEVFVCTEDNVLALGRQKPVIVRAMHKVV
jgi:hypothetical protein